MSGGARARMGGDGEPSRGGAQLLGRDLVGVRVSVWWEDDGRWYAGTVRDFSALGEHLILYDDGEQRQEVLDECRWRTTAGLEAARIDDVGKESRQSKRSLRTAADAPDARPSSKRGTTLEEPSPPKRARGASRRAPEELSMLPQASRREAGSKPSRWLCLSCNRQNGPDVEVCEGTGADGRLCHSSRATGLSLLDGRNRRGSFIDEISSIKRARAQA